MVFRIIDTRLSSSFADMNFTHMCHVTWLRSWRNDLIVASGQVVSLVSFYGKGKLASSGVTHSALW